MSAITLSRLVALIGTVGAIMACNDSMSPQPGGGGAPGGGAPGSGASSDFTLIPRIATIRAGQVITLEARMIDEFGDAVQDGFSWRSSNDAVATVAATGAVYGRSVGVVTVTATALGKHQESVVRVLQREPKPQ
jgi:Bacterial Ig-like domain (group 2)